MGKLIGGCKDLWSALATCPIRGLERTKNTGLMDLLFLTLAAVLCGCDEWEAAAACGEKEAKLAAQVYRTAAGIAAHDAELTAERTDEKTGRYQTQVRQYIRDTTTKAGIRRKRKIARWDDRSLKQLLAQLFRCVCPVLL